MNDEVVPTDELLRLRADSRRLDWLADPANKLGQVLLPRRCIEENPDSMRAAIDMAMEQSE